MAAFRMAVDAGADMLEFDVRLTRDQVLVVHHDRRLGRTSDGTGCVHDLTYDQIRRCDAGGWYARKFRGEGIPSLREVLAAFPASVGMNIEVKTDGDTRRRAGCADALLHAMEESGRSALFIVSSFDHAFLRRLHRRSPIIRIGALYLPVRDTLRSPAAVARRVGASVFICSRSQLRRRHVRDAHAHHIAVAAYGVNTPADLAAVQRAGVDAVITDHPERIVRALRNA
jgi:glycerophosphoryl diester phosphodiesterase